MNKVSLVSCEDYNYEKVKRKLVESFNNIGGIDKYISKGDKVLLKINLLMKKSPEEATTTHPIFTKALAEILAEYGAKVVIGDSPAGPFNIKSLKSIYKACGMTKIIEDLDNPNITLNYNIEYCKVINPKAKLLKQLTITDMIKDVDKVISVSKLKTHGMCTFTGAVKNMFGIIPGVLKAEYHFKMSDIKDFTDALTDICLYANPILSFMDGIVGMEGAGPSAGDPRNVGVIIASDSPYYLDKVATDIINLKDEKVPTIMRSIERRFILKDSSDLDIVGEQLNNHVIKDFKVPKTRSIHFIDDNFPDIIKKIADKSLRPKPIFNHDICVGCEDCKNSCPADVIEMIDNKPVVDLDQCIRCFCCQELCPAKAVEIKRPILMKLISKL
mgnify:CR=1 FL=1